MAVLRSWTRRSKERVDALEITEDKVYVACYEGGDSSAVGCTRAEFVAGKLNKVVEDVFGSLVLGEALQYLVQRH